jgi:HpcH/HpaI aldolase/citrate lyase family
VTEFELSLFASDHDVVARAVGAGVQSVVVDWEFEGKAVRQANADTEVNRHTVDDLRRVKASGAARVLCRINRLGSRTDVEVAAAVAAGADEILLPMVRSAADVEAALELLGGRAGLGILVETREAVAAAPELGRLPISRAYVGLNDLAIERGTASIFAPLADGTLDEVRAAFTAVPFGFGGLTLPERGAPVPSRLLIGELARLRCAFSFLRRSFHRDVVGLRVEREIPRIAAAVAAAFARSAAEEARDRDELLAAIAGRGTQELDSVALA